MSESATPLEPRLHVICLCAQWCGTCRDYASRFEQIGKSFPQVRFSWIDIEDEADLVDPIEIETFPTLLITRNGDPIFFGSLLPHFQTLERLVRNSLAENTARTLEDPALMGLMARLEKSGRIAF
jgi:thiol-disulfide isomerase/thioredoxin